MKDELHGRAQNLLDVARVEGLSAADQEWLDSHLDACGDCRLYAKSLECTVAALRTHSVPLNPRLLETTRKRLLVRAHELREQEARMRALWVSCALSWVLGLLSAPLLWWGLVWIGQHTSLPKPWWYLAFVFWWMMPAVVAGGVLTWHHTRAAAENGFAATRTR